MSTSARLSKIFENAEVIPYDACSRFVIASDCHRGIGNWGDNFLPNQNLFFAALKYYYQKDYTYIELGDGDELWENRNMQQIIQVHSNVFWLLSRFYEEGRFYMLFGNHDKIKQNKKFLQASCHQYYCESANEYFRLFPNLKVHEGIILHNWCTRVLLFLTHGNQGDFINDRGWRIGRFLVRYLWRPLELVGVNDPTSAAKNYSKKSKIEQRLSDWAEDNRTILIAGHTHRPYFSSPGEGMYFNDGSCVHPRCITNLEIENNNITLVKWSVMTREDRSLYVGREVLEGPVYLREYQRM